MSMYDLLKNYESGNTMRLFMKDEKQYVVNNCQYKKYEFLRMLNRVASFKVIHHNN